MTAARDEATRRFHIGNISLTYKNETIPALTRDEVRDYVASASFCSDVFRYSATGVIVIDYRTWSYLYCSENMKEIVGVDPQAALQMGPAFLLSHVHPDDLASQEEAHRFALSFFRDLPPAERTRYKCSFTFRFTTPQDRCVQILQTSIFLKWGASGPEVKLILFSDISRYKDNDDVVFFITRSDESRANEVVVHRNFTTSANALTARELDVARELLVSGEPGQIATTLGLTLNTVKSHKRAIMRKFGCRRTTELVSLLKLCGLDRDVSQIRSK